MRLSQTVRPAICLEAEDLAIALLPQCKRDAYRIFDLSNRLLNGPA
jgi:hypothetical protein